MDAVYIKEGGCREVVEVCAVVVEACTEEGGSCIEIEVYKEVGEVEIIYSVHNKV